MSQPPRPTDLWAIRLASLGAVVGVFPLGAMAVFGGGADRLIVADATAWVFSVGLAVALSSSFLPLPGLRSWSLRDRARSAALLFVAFSAATHLTWELVQLLATEAILAHRDAAWTYPWWAYFDGGDARQVDPTTDLLAMEILAVLNGIIGAVGLVLWRRGRQRLAWLFLCVMAVVHLYSTGLYYLSEALSGFAHVDTSRPTDLWIKFGLVNAPWLTVPWVVLWWSWSGLLGRGGSLREGTGRQGAGGRESEVGPQRATPVDPSRPRSSGSRRPGPADR